MKQFIAQYFKDFKANFTCLNAYIIVGFYYILSFFSALYLGDYFSRESYILNSYFTIQPTILMLIIPAITMRSWADEIKTGTFELLLTQPISYTKLVLAKFLSAYSFLFFLFLSMLPLLYVTNYISIVDYGATALSFWGLMLCGALFTSLGCFVSTLNRHNVLCYISTILVIIIVEQINFSSISLSDGVISLRSLNFEDNYRAFLSGVFAIGNVIYFVLGTLLVLWFNVVLLVCRKSVNKTEKKSVISFATIIFLIFISGTLGCSLFFDRSYDVTDQRKFTLASDSIDFLTSTEQKINITLYEAKNKREEANSSYAVYAEYVEYFLKLIERISGGAVRSQFMFVEPFSVQERTLLRQNIPYKEDNMSNKVFMAADFTDNEGHRQSINAFSGLRQNLLESDILRVLRRFNLNKQKIAVIASSDDLAKMTALDALFKEFYDVTYLSSNLMFIPPTYAAVVVINPSYISSEFLLAMDQYILNGGNLLIFAEPNISNYRNDKILNSFLTNYGIQLNLGAILETTVENETTQINLATLAPNEQWRGLRSVVVNGVGSVSLKKHKDYTVNPILYFDKEPLAAVSSGKFSSNYWQLSLENPAIIPNSIKPGKVFFFYDTDFLKNYTYVSNDAKISSFYEIVPIADNMLFFLRLLDFATNENIEPLLSYNHYIINGSDIGHMLHNNIKLKYQKEIDDLEVKIASYSKQQATSFSKESGTVRDFAHLNNQVRDIEEAKDRLSQINAAISTEYQTIILIFVIVLGLVVPCMLILAMALFIALYRHYKSRKIGRLIENVKTH